MQSALNKYRVYLALPRLPGSSSKVPSCHLIFPLDESSTANDTNLLQKFAFDSVHDKIYERIERVLEQQVQLQEDQAASDEQGLKDWSHRNAEDDTVYTQISTALLQALCYANQFNQQYLNIKQSKGSNLYQNGNSRILVLQMDKDDPSQYTKMVNGLFAAQKM